MFRRDKANHPHAYYCYCYTKPEKKHPLEYAIFSFVVLTTFATCYAAWYVRGQAIAAREANIIVQRPYITVTELDIREEYAGDVPRNEFLGWSFRPIIENSGATPTQNLRLAHEIIIFNNFPETDFYGSPVKRHGVELPAEPEDPDAGFSKENSIRALIGPHSKVNIPQNKHVWPIPNGNMGWIAQGHSSAYVLGSIHYSDGFENTDEHITRYCFRISARGDGANPRTTTIGYDLCRFWNCADNECEDDKSACEKEAARLAAIDTQKPP
jgi:hypothetical protein